MTIKMIFRVQGRSSFEWKSTGCLGVAEFLKMPPDPATGFRAGFRVTREFDKLQTQGGTMDLRWDQSSNEQFWRGRPLGYVTFSFIGVRLGG